MPKSHKVRSRPIFFSDSQGVNVEGAKFKVKLIPPEETLFLQVDQIRKNGPLDIAQGVFTVLGIDFQLKEYFVECSQDPIISPCLQNYFDDIYGTTDVNNITEKHFNIENIKIRGPEYFFNTV